MYVCAVHVRIPPQLYMLTLARPSRRAASSTRPSRRWFHIRGVRDVRPRPHEPLDILFCGADHFSIASLRAIWALSQKDPGKIRSIDVVCRKDKRAGRGLKQIQAVPIKAVAQELQLGLHQIDTFTGWQPPASVHLIIAVSFGLLVPARIINGAKYGGLNVHPSLLPDLRGPAPIQHAIMRGRQYTGVTLQTMHPTRFDDGVILAQTGPESVSLSNNTTTQELTSRLSIVGAEVLRRSLEAGLFVEPLQDLGQEMPDAALDHAPKIISMDRHIDWDTWTAAEFSRRDRAIGNLWDITTAHQILQNEKHPRLTFAGPWTVLTRQEGESSNSPGSPLLVSDGKDHRLGFCTADGQVISPASATLEASARGTGLDTLIRSLKAKAKKGKAETLQDKQPESGTPQKARL